jgi:Cu+-exporting ATPase
MGILIKGGESLERIQALTAVVLDKTGTVTEGKPRLTDLLALAELPAEDVLRLAAGVERASEHPLGQAIVRGAEERGLSLPPTPAVFRSITGGGVQGTIEEHDVLVGSRRLLAEQGIELEQARETVESLEAEGKTALLVAFDGRLGGVLAVADTIKEGAAEAVGALQALGLEATLLTGDNVRTAATIGRQAGIARVVAEVRPEEKAADVGIAMGTGTDVAMAAADITLVRGDLRSVPEAIALSRSTMRTIKQNLFWAFFYNVILIPLAALGLINPIFAAAAMALSSVTVVSNSLRLGRFRGTPRDAHASARGTPATFVAAA